MRRRTVIRQLPDGSTEITTVSQGCLAGTLSWIFWIWVVAFVLVAPAQLGLWSVPLYAVEALMLVSYVANRVAKYRARRNGGPG